MDYSFFHVYIIRLYLTIIPRGRLGYEMVESQRGRPKNCSVIYLSQSFYKAPKDIRLNCGHYLVYDFPSSNERNLISRELGVTKVQFIKATKQPCSFLYVDKPMKTVKRNFYGLWIYHNIII